MIITGFILYIFVRIQFSYILSDQYHLLTNQTQMGARYGINQHINHIHELTQQVKYILWEQDDETHECRISLNSS